MRPPALSLVLNEFPQRYEAIVRFLRRRLGSVEDAREVAHETWLRLAEQAGTEASCGPAADARAYLYTVAANLGQDRQRRAHWLQAHLQQGREAGAGVDHTPDVAEGLMYRQALSALDATLMAMPARVRDVFVAHRIHGEAQADIALRLGVSLNTVERDLMAAHDRVDTALRHWRGEPRRGLGGPTQGRRKSLASLLGAAAVGVLGLVGGWRYRQTQALHWAAALSTPQGQRLQQGLPDGSMLTLDAQTRVEMAFDARRRTVRLLRGAAFFAVSTDADRPFTVEVGALSVTVLGTRFGVDIEPAGTVLVQVESGRVRVARAAQVLAAGLTAGQGLRVAPDGRSQAVIGPAAAWRQGRVHFDAVPLGEAVERLARYAKVDLRADPRTAQLRVSGTVEIARWDDWLQALPAVLPVRVVRDSEGGVMLMAR